MNVVKIANNIYQFVFIKETSEFPLNITALLEDDTAILIDTAYAKYADEVKNYLSKQGISNYVIMISHHHEDHFDGCKSFVDSTTFASELFVKDYQQHLETDDFLKSFKPNRFLYDNGCYKTQKFTIDYIYTPGHNKCEFSFYINKKYFYVGDLIFFNKDGLTSLPYIDANSEIDEYIESLLKIKELSPECILLGHGYPIFGEAEIEEQISSRLFYLEAIKNSRGDILIDDCINGTKELYSGLNFHKSNLLKCVK
jgi:glyoxylase-like metal-dependent hydrolase (beta-lactamase superfamily II)